MADPRHPTRDMGKGSEFQADQALGGVQEPALVDADRDEFAHALDAALDAIRTALDEDDVPAFKQKPVAAAPAAQAARGPVNDAPAEEPPAAMRASAPVRQEYHTEAIATSAQPAAQQSYRIANGGEISSRVAPAPRPERIVPQPSPIAKASFAGSMQTGSAVPGATGVYNVNTLQPERTIAEAAYRPIAANDSGRHHRAAPEQAPRRLQDPRPVPQPSPARPAQGRQNDPYWTHLMTEIQNDLDDAPRQRSGRGLRPEDLPSFGKNMDDNESKPTARSFRLATVSAIALTAVIGFVGVTWWNGGGINVGSIVSFDGQRAAPKSDNSGTAPSLASVAPADAGNSAPSKLEVGAVMGQAGMPISLNVSVAPRPSERTAVLVSGLPRDATLSAGVDTGKGVWIVKPEDLSQLAMTTPADYSGTSDVKFELVAPNGLTLDVQSANVAVKGGPVTATVPASQPLAASLAPKPVKTASVTMANPVATPLVAPTQTASSDSNNVSAPPLVPRFGGNGGGGTGGSAPAPQTAETSPAAAPSNNDPVQNVVKTAGSDQPALVPQTVRVASVNPTQALAAPTATAALPSADSAEVKEMVSRGTALMDIGDLAAARLFFERAAEMGSANAVMALAMSYDPVYFEERGVQGLPPNASRAVELYERANQLGAAQAQDRLARLKARIARQ